ncbi:hypothetical protein Plhal304r1_c039g0117171 [Plasmopara halstedii]
MSQLVWDRLGTFVSCAPLPAAGIRSDRVSSGEGAGGCLVRSRRVNATTLIG